MKLSVVGRLTSLFITTERHSDVWALSNYYVVSIVLAVKHVFVCGLQIKRWGEVEWHHAVEETDLKARLSAAMILRQLDMT